MKAKVPRKPSLSPTRISTYLACPVKYYYNFLDPKARFYVKPKSYYSFGSSLHNVLQSFFQDDSIAVKTQEEVFSAVENSWIDAGYTSPTEMSEAMGEGVEIIQNFVLQHQAKPQVSKTLFVEKQLRTDLGQFNLIGRLDRVEEWEDGTLEIIDYKSGRADVSAEEIAHDLAMSCYQLLMHKAFPGRNIIATIIALRTGNAASYGFSADELSVFEQDLVSLGNHILNTNFEELEPVRKSLCDSCDFLKLCKPTFDVQLLI